MYVVRYVCSYSLQFRVSIQLNCARGRRPCVHEQVAARDPPFVALAITTFRV
eukprot:COSAG02_NODE_3419_length_6778_cov_2.101362_7_plen_52_part_00